MNLAQVLLPECIAAASSIAAVVGGGVAADEGKEGDLGRRMWRRMLLVRDEGKETWIYKCMAALVVGLATETETVVMIKKRATVKDLDVLWKMTIVTSATAGYHLLHLLRCMALVWHGKNPSQDNKFVAWFYFVLDQGVTYATFGVTMAGLEVAFVAAFGVSELQWSRLCNIYTRFCVEIGGGLFCGLVASLAMAIVASISAYHLFRLYPRRPHSSKVLVSRRQWLHSLY
ncbi:CASP-like protein 2C1 [Canna indica]|uniref:CASP-like protein n=1 Tax=Canna indica TaxID=4628 RepID=A0AAQ3QR19_9LILI|nr:CASP-like protein 2C1 [Canna indica]